MKILVFSQHFWPESFRINDVEQPLHDAGHEVTVLSGQPNCPGGHVFNAQIGRPSDLWAALQALHGSHQKDWGCGVTVQFARQ